MNWEAIGAVGEIAGAIAVVASLVYLAVQIRQNTNSTQASNELEVSKSASNWVSRATTDPGIRKAWNKLAAEKELSDEEMNQLLWYWAEWFHLCEGWYQQYKRGLMSESVWQTRSSGTLGFLQHDFALAWWRSDSMSIDPEFRDYIDSQLATGKANWTVRSGDQFRQ